MLSNTFTVYLTFTNDNMFKNVIWFTPFSFTCYIGCCVVFQLMHNIKAAPSGVAGTYAIMATLKPHVNSDTMV